MASYLALVKAVGRETGTLPNWSTLSTLVGANERTTKIMEWVKQAWINLQNERDDWFWMRATGTATLTINTTQFVPADAPFSLTRFGRWVEDGELDGLYPMSIYETSIGVEDEGDIPQISYGQWFDRYGRGYHDANRPTEYAVGPDGKILIGPKPDLGTYVLRFHYMKSPQELSADADVPELPTRFHNIIVWEAIKLLQASGAMIDRRAIAIDELATLKSALIRMQLPEIQLGGGPIA